MWVHCSHLSSLYVTVNIRFVSKSSLVLHSNFFTELHSSFLIYKVEFVESFSP